MLRSYLYKINHYTTMNILLAPECYRARTRASVDHLQGTYAANALTIRTYVETLMDADKPDTDCT